MARHTWKFERGVPGFTPSGWRSGTLFIRRVGTRWILYRSDLKSRDVAIGSYDSKQNAMRDAETLPNPKRMTKTVDVSLPLTEAQSKEWLKRRFIPYTHMRALSGGGTAFRIRRGYALDFRREKDKSAPRYDNRAAAARQMTRGRRRNPTRATKYETTVNGVRVMFFQGYAEDIRYQRAADGQPYSHVVETDAAELYLCEHPTYGRCLMIVDPSGKTPLWN